MNISRHKNSYSATLASGHAHSCKETGVSQHLAQFYEHDRFLVGVVSEFIAGGLRAGSGVIVVATASHRQAIQAHLRSQAVGLDAAILQGQCLFLDAAETLASFMVNGWPDARLFNKVVGEQVARFAKSWQGLKAFGEMVALLCEEGNFEAALELEELWNDLALVREFSLLCAYPLQAFQSQRDSAFFTSICNEHARVFPTESLTFGANAHDEQLREIVHLQLKALALDGEIKQRKQAEEDLRRSQAELKVFLETASIGLHWVGPDGRILWANAAVYEMLGYKAEEYLGHYISEFHADHRVIEDIFIRLFRDEKLSNYRALLKTKAGSLKTVLIDSSVLWEEGRFVHTQCFTRDITAYADAAQAAIL
ncbi:MAG: MEDS domain-containing protein [Candidatus Sericytochromatia bacterium]